ISASINLTQINSNVSSYFVNNVSIPFKSKFSWFYYKKYTIISNVVEGQKPNYLNSLTLVLHISNDRNFDWFRNSLKNWEGPISVGIYMSDNKIISLETECIICVLKNHIKDRKMFLFILFLKINLIFQMIK
uniref:Uncharacterized protein n=1 Tax=Strongyloides stercoralis TaxID=6248 RepID=A0AAF5D063_STRER